MNDGITILESFKTAVLKKFEEKENAIETRRRWYEDAAFKLVRVPMHVCFAVRYNELDMPLRGLVELIRGRYYISLAPNLPIKQEHKTWAHEVGHIVTRPCRRNNAD